MTVMDIVVKDNLDKIAHKHVLEMISDHGHFSEACQPYARSVTTTVEDLRDMDTIEGGNVSVLAPGDLSLYGAYVETLVCCNGMTSLSKNLIKILDAVKARPDIRTFLIINTRPMDKVLAYDLLMPVLSDMNLRYTIKENPTYQGIVISK